MIFHAHHFVIIEIIIIHFRCYLLAFQGIPTNLIIDRITKCLYIVVDNDSDDDDDDIFDESPNFVNCCDYIFVI